MNHSEALDYLHRASLRGARLGLERVTELVSRLGDPQKQVPVIHISGTNGKGSVGAMLAAVLQAAGFRTGHFATPAIVRPADPFRINGTPITDERFAALLTDVQAQAEQMSDRPTEYEILAAAAYLLFAQEHCEIAVVECCMGGDSDCTNVIDRPLLSVITNVRKDHCNFLGNTLPEIAAHKAGIIKPGCPALTGCKNPATLAVLRAYAEKVHAPFFLRTEVPEQISMTLNGTDLLSRYFGNVHLSLPGAYQPENAALVLDAVRILREQGISLPDTAVHAGLAAVRWPGRFEVLHREPFVLFDGAHNPDGMQSTTASLRHYFGTDRPLVFVMGVMADKEYELYPALLRDLAYRVYTVTPENPRALPADTLSKTFTDAGIPAQACETVSAALTLALHENKPVMGLGSLYLYREFLQAFQIMMNERKL